MTLPKELRDKANKEMHDGPDAFMSGVEWLYAEIEPYIKYVPHIPQSYETGMGGANNSPCTPDCPKCFLEKS